MPLRGTRPTSAARFGPFRSAFREYKGECWQVREADKTGKIRLTKLGRRSKWVQSSDLGNWCG